MTFCHLIGIFCHQIESVVTVRLSFSLCSFLSQAYRWCGLSCLFIKVVFHQSGLTCQEVSNARLSFTQLGFLVIFYCRLYVLFGQSISGGPLWEVSFNSGCHLSKVFFHVRWCLMSGGLSCQVLFHVRWSLMSGGLSCQVVSHVRWSHVSGGLSCEVVSPVRWSLVSGGLSCQVVSRVR